MSNILRKRIHKDWNLSCLSNFRLVTALMLLTYTAATAAGTADFFNRALIVEEVDSQTGVVKNQFLDVLKDAGNGSYWSFAPDISSFTWFGACLNADNKPCTRS